MRTKIKIVLAFLANLILLSSQILAGIPPITFESPDYVPYQPVGLDFANGWRLFAGEAHVTGAGLGRNGGQALVLPADQQREPWLRKVVDWDSQEPTAFIDFQIKPIADPEGSYANFYANGSQIAFQTAEGGLQGDIWVYHGNDGDAADPANPSQWFKTAASFPLSGGGNTSASYLRITIRHDYGRNLWDLFVDGKLVAANLSYEGRGPNLGALEFFGSRNGDTLLDDLSVDPVNMLFADIDKDGLPDAWEVANGSDPNFYDRDEIKPGTGTAFIDLYMDSLWGAGSVNANAIIVPSVGIPPLQILGSHQPVGSLKGTFSIGSDGASNYSIPIDVPKGTAGMEPKLSLGYSSGGGNGLVGLGFELSGLQSITRGPSTKAQDGFIDGMDFDSNDRFYFNGERLVCISGSYGADGAEYRTLLDSFARIRSFGSYQGGPARWEVETKAGLKLYFGSAPGNADLSALDPLAWRVCRVEDTMGNYYTCSYNKETVDATTSPGVSSISSYPSEIRYTGNANQGAAPYVVVRFAWQDRQDRTSGVAAGIRYHANKRLKTIGVYYDPSGASTGSKIHEYQLTYLDEESGFGSWQEYQGRSMLPVSKLSSIGKVNADGDSIPATTIKWTDDSSVVSELPAAPGYVGNSADMSKRDMSRFKYGDFNGDGITDVCYINGYGNSAPCTIHLYQKGGGYLTSQGPSLYVTASTEGVLRDTQRVVLADFNGDGMSDIYRIEGFGGPAAGSLYLSQGDGSFSPRIAGPVLMVGSTTDTSKRDLLRFKFGDFNGDGITDLCYVNGFGTSEACSIFIFQRDGTFVSGSGPVLPVSGNTDGCIRDTQRVMLADFNGDGKTDINRINSWGSAEQCSLYLSLGDGSFGSRIFGPALWIGDSADQFERDMSRVKYGDFNGDGITDICYINGYGTSEPCAIYRFQHDGTFVQSAGPSLYVTANTAGVLRDTQRVVPGDFNGDGCTDLYRIESYGNAVPGSIYHSMGDGTFMSRVNGPALMVRSTTDTFRRDMLRFKFGDVNGDGITDLCYVNGYGTSEPVSVFLFQRDQSFISREGPVVWVGDSTDACIRDLSRVVQGDFNGDGRSDFMRIDGWASSACRIWQFESDVPVVDEITDGFGSDLQIEYRSLNDPSAATGFGSAVYGKFQGILPTGQIGIMNGRSVVSRYSEPDGRGGRRYKSQRYGDLRYDRVNETSLGFGWIEALDELTAQVTRTESSRTYPFAGSPVYSETKVMLAQADIDAMPPSGAAGAGLTPGWKCLTTETASYAEMPTQQGVGGIIRRPVQTNSIKSLFDLDGSLKGKTTTAQPLASFDAYGFVTSSTVTALDGSTVSTSNQYYHNTANGKWHLGRLSQSAVVKSGGGKPSITKTTSFSYDNVTGLLKSETVETGHPLSVTTSYAHDVFGNITQTSVAASGEVRTASSTYDERGRFVISESNQLGHTVYHDYDFQRAVLNASTDINGNTTAFTYDGFGTLILTHHPDGTRTGEVTGYAGNHSLPASVASHLTNPIAFFRAKQSSGSPPSKVYLDALGRELVTETTILRNTAATDASRYSKVYVVTQYDERGRKIAVSDVFAAGESPLFTRIDYDFLNRTIKTTHPDQTFDRILEHGPRSLGGQPVTYSKAANRNGQILERWEDQHGRMIQSMDPSGQVNTFQHDQEGRLLSVTVGGQTLLTNTWDLFGNRLSVTEANSGTSTSTYNGFGEMISGTNARGQTTTTSYDALGRVISVVKPEGTFTMTYDGAPGAGLGQPWKTTGPDNYQESVSYDGYGRAIATTTTRFGETFTTTTTYDSLGRVATSTDAGGLTVVNEYDATYSFPLSIHIGPGVEAAGTLLWKALTFDAKGRAVSQTLAQGVVTGVSYNPASGLVEGLVADYQGTLIQSKACFWEPNGNLRSRTDLLAKRSESFTYDHLNRVTGSSVIALPGASITTVPPPEQYSYDTKGNLVSKTGAALHYGGPRPHAVTSATIKGTSRAYAYDAAGYVTSDGKRSYSWTSFGQLKSLNYPAAPALQDLAGASVFAASDVETQFDFDAGGNRARQIKKRIDLSGSRAEEETLYLGGYEREIHGTRANASATIVHTKTVHRHSLGAAVYTRTVDGSGTTVKLTTVIKDHLGSTDVLLTGAWNGSGFSTPSVENQSFDPWGERRKSDTWATYRLVDADAYHTTSGDFKRGYTGHEQLDDSGLIHMNGRIYDPELGRFLSPDPVVQIPEYSQDFNRYSYVLNNPLNATDPSGFSWLSKAFSKVGSWLKENWRSVVSIVVGVLLMLTPGGQALIGAIGGMIAPGAVGVSWTVAQGVVVSATQMVGGAVVGGIMGGVNAALAGGDLGDVLRGMAVGAIQGAISSGPLHALEGVKGMQFAHISGHGVLGGASNAAMGGKFQDGFLSAAAAAAAGHMGISSKFNGDNVLHMAARTSVASAVGGTASALGGGKFANGAYTAAFQHLLNKENAGLRAFEGSVRLTYSVKNKILTFYNAATGEAAAFYAVSGTGDYRTGELSTKQYPDMKNDSKWEWFKALDKSKGPAGPIPRATYRVTSWPNKKAGLDSFGLNAIDANPTDDTIYGGGSSRGLLLIHLGTPGGVGCIVFPPSLQKEFGTYSRFLDYMSRANTTSWRSDMYGAQKQYGILTVSN